MSGYIIRRVIVGMFMLLGLSLLIFVMLRLTPGDPIDAYVDPSIPITPADLEVLRVRLGLDQPLPVQYFAWLAAALTGDFGFSFQRGEAVLPLVLSRIGPTILLMLTGLAIAVVFGIVAGIIGAVRRNGAIDLIFSVLAFIGLSSPAFLTALLGLYAFSVALDWAPAGGMLTPGKPFSIAISRSILSRSKTAYATPLPENAVMS